LQDFIHQALLGLGEYAMSLEKKPFSCEQCCNDDEFIWKTRHGKKTKVLTVFHWISLPQMQVQCKRCGHKFYITRKLLGMEPRKMVPVDTYRRLGLMGSLTTYRVAEKVVRMFGWSVDKMTIWKAVQKTANDLEFKADPDGLAHGEADGTGVPIVGIKKRGKELKVFVQYKKGGGVRIAGMGIGNYGAGWERLFKGSIDVLKGFKRFLLVTDGEASIVEDLKGKVGVIFQRCLWHIPHQLKYVLWRDKVKRKTKDWQYMLSEILQICTIRPLMDCEEAIKSMIVSKQKRLNKLIRHCRLKGYTHTATYLKKAQGNMFAAISNGLYGKTTSKVERVFRTVNMRINVGKWSPSGGLNVSKVRLAYLH